MTDTAPAPNLPGDVLMCSLTGHERAERGRWLERLHHHSLGIVASANGVTAEFPASDQAEAELRALAVAEARCCPFLTFDLTRKGDRLRLTVSGPPQARPIIETMFGGLR